MQSKEKIRLRYLLVPAIIVTTGIIYICGDIECLQTARFTINSAEIAAQKVKYPSVIQEITPPRGFTRKEASPGSFQSWLRGLSLKKRGSPVRLYNGKKKKNQSAHYAVINMSVGKKNLQQCADAIMRIRAEYLFSTKEYDKIGFNFTSGHRIPFVKWAKGYRPVIRGNRIRWIKKGRKDYSHNNLLHYLETVYVYAGTYSLSQEMKVISNVKDISGGDVFIKGGFPGHAVIVVDVAVNSDTGEKVFLLAQSFMPAQDIHILRNPSSAGSDPWYSTDFGKQLITPEWTFLKKHLKRFQ